MTDGERREIDTVVDAAIDRVVREMMRVEPPTYMRERVVARLEHPARPLLTIPRVAAAAALTALGVLAIVLTREPVREPPETTVVERTAEVPVQQPSRESANDAGERPDDEERIARAAPRGRTAAQDDGQPRAPFAGAIAIAPLPPLDPIVVRPLQPSPVESEAIVIEPLAPIDELEIAPLFPSEGRD